jgi:transglutaminase-like putative cysteine protease
MPGSDSDAFAAKCPSFAGCEFVTPDKINCDPNLPMRSHIDHFGNRVTRVEVPAGLVAFFNRFVIHDSGQPEETPSDVDMTPIADLPDDVLLFLLQSRYCGSDKLADFAWSNFGMILGGRQRVQAICDFVHAKIRFSYPNARPTRSASDSMDEGIGVCRDLQAETPDGIGGVARACRVRVGYERACRATRR